MLENQSFDCGTEGGECSLSPEDFVERVERWKLLGKQALTRTTLGEGRIVSAYPHNARIRHQLTELIAAEAACCPFFVFEVRDQPETIEVELTYPPEFEAMVALAVNS